MAAKETVGKSKICIVLPILDRISQLFFVLYILEVIHSEYAKKISKKAAVNLSKDHKIYFFVIDFPMHWSIKQELYIKHHRWRFIYNGWQWGIRLILPMYMNMSTQVDWFVRLLTDSTVRMQTVHTRVMQTTHWYVKEHAVPGPAQNQLGYTSWSQPLAWSSSHIESGETMIFLW